MQDFIKGENERKRTRNPLVHHFSSSRLAILTKIVASSLAVCVLLVPVLVLFLVELSREKMAGIVGGSVLVFMVTMSVLVDVTPHDLFIGIAAYSAVLVALLSNLAQGMGSGNARTYANGSAGQ